MHPKIKSIVRHHLYMKTGSGYDRTFPDAFVFGWGKTNIQQVFRKEEMNAMRDEQLEAMRNDPTSAIFDYQVSSAERLKHVNSDMFMNGTQDSDSYWGNPKQWKDYGDSAWNDYGDYGSQSDSSRRWYH